MKLPIQKTHFGYLVIIFFLYLGTLFVFKPQIFSYTFDPELVDRYLCSQDIPTEPPCKRLFLSDEEIHIAVGYLYSQGAAPTEYNFQHSPFIKYTYGLGIQFIGNPYYVQILYGITLLGLTYALGYKLTKKHIVGLLASLFLIFDPLFLDLSSSALLDLGQAVFLLAFLTSALFYSRQYVLQGVMLGLLVASKFWGGVIFFIAAHGIYLMYTVGVLDAVKLYMKISLVAFAVFVLTYSKSFYDMGGRFNFVFYELKVIKYWLNHSISSLFGSSLILFITGYVKSWWGSKEFIQSDIWSFVWPVGLAATSYQALLRERAKKYDPLFFISILPLTYLVYLGFQAAFPRYFILILPFIYIGIGVILSDWYQKVMKS